MRMIQNPVLRGFSPDPSVVRVGDTYYVATSTFEWFPGVRIYRTKDLEHYEQLPSPLVRESQLHMEGNPDSCGVWAPDLSWDGERFWLVFTDVKTRGTADYFNTHNYIVWTYDIMGEWSEPVYLNSAGFDPSLFHDTDGRSYLVNMINGFKGIRVQEFDKETKKLTGPAKNVCAGTGRGFTEGPHIYHIGEWYYLMMAEGGTSYEHCEVLCRSRDLWGGYEEDPGNPILTSNREDRNALQKCGHADLVQTQSGEWYLFHLCARPDERGVCVLGRETAVQKVFWNEDGWLRLSAGGRYGRMTTEAPVGYGDCDGLTTGGPAGSWKDGTEGADKGTGEEPSAEKYADRTGGFEEEFDRPVLDPSFSTLRVPPEKVLSLTARKGWLRLYGHEFLTSCFRTSLLARKQSCRKSRMECGMEFSPRSEQQGAGAAYFYDTHNFYLLILTKDGSGSDVLRFLRCRSGAVEVLAEQPLSGDGEADGTWKEVPDASWEETPDGSERYGQGRMLHLRIETDKSGEQAVFSWSRDGQTYIKVAEADTEILTDEHCVGFTGAHFGVYCHDMADQSDHADFKYFRVLEDRG